MFKMTRILALVLLTGCAAQGPTLNAKAVEDAYQLQRQLNIAFMQAHNEAKDRLDKLEGKAPPVTPTVTPAPKK